MQNIRHTIQTRSYQLVFMKFGQLSTLNCTVASFVSPQMYKIKLLTVNGKLSTLNCLLLLCLSYSGWAQKSIKLAARPMPDSIVLRWAPNKKEVWKQANQLGYKIERVTIAENKKLLKVLKVELLTLEGLKPQPLAAWEPLAKSSTYGAITAQALYGETFEVNDKKQKGKSMIRKAYEKDLETEMRYSFALTSADLDARVAQASGLRWVDKSAKKGTQYLYRVYVANLATSEAIDTGFVYTSVDEYEPLPAPLEFSVAFFDSTAALSWNYKQLQKYFIAYDIERSVDGGKTYQKRNEEPFVPINENVKNKYAFYMDSTLPNITIYYRIRGLSAFGEYGKYGETTQGMSKPLIHTAPKQVKANVLGGKKVLITWEFEKFSLSQVTAFKVYRSVNYETGYTVVSKLPLAKTVFQFEDLNPLQEAYYKVVAVDQQGAEKASFPVFAQREDNEPPKAPTGFKAVLTKEGVLSLTWKANSEKDLLGYYVYKSNSRKQEYARITDSHIEKTSFEEKVAMNALTDSLYYKVIALDIRFNESKPSVVAVKRPDVLPPAPIAFKTMRADTAGVLLVWANSPSKDVVKYKLSRIEYPENIQMLLANIKHKGDTTLYVDKNMQANKTYSYEVVAIDDDSLISEKTQSVQLRKHSKEPAIAAAKVTIQRTEDRKKIILDWKSSAPDIDYWIIYRGSLGERLSQYESVSGDLMHFEDKEIEVSKMYYYHIRPVLQNGQMGELSEKVEVN